MKKKSKQQQDNDETNVNEDTTEALELERLIAQSRRESRFSEEDVASLGPALARYMIDAGLIPLAASSRGYTPPVYGKEIINVECGADTRELVRCATGSVTRGFFGRPTYNQLDALKDDARERAKENARSLADPDLFRCEGSCQTGNCPENPAVAISKEPYISSHPGHPRPFILLGLFIYSPEATACVKLKVKCPCL